MSSCSEDETSGFNAIEGNMPTIKNNTSININNIYGVWQVESISIDDEILDYQMNMTFNYSDSVMFYVYDQGYYDYYYYNWYFETPNKIYFEDENETVEMTIARLSSNELILIDDYDGTKIVAYKSEY